MSQLRLEKRPEEASRPHRRFEVPREVCKLRDFGLVLCATLSGYVGEYLLRALEAVAEEKERAGDLIVSSPNPWCDTTCRIVIAAENLVLRFREDYMGLCQSWGGGACETVVQRNLSVNRISRGLTQLLDKQT